MARKSPVRHMVKPYVRKRKNGKSYSSVRQHARGSGVASKKSLRGTPAYLSERPSPSEVLRAGYGVGVRVELIAKQAGWNGQPMDPKFSHPIGSTGTITGHFSADPVVHWDSEERKDAGQVVEANKLKVIGKTSGRKEIIATVNYDKLKRELSGDQLYESGNKVTIMKTEPVFDDVGYIVGDVTYQLIGVKHGDHVNFDTPKLDLRSVPRSHRWHVRQYWESQSPVDMFGVLED